ncbi:MerR family transcriptional regulator [Actinospica durhamensis]|uniref:MerR family transcriptional regulator n=1 Tax=Actinospica durhamensis TaxID=1508375 RepID=A0A941IPV7_9ACTN|nr:helix-turn-helix domain-containing protein [Actinospica durhamensis]MBR7833532.1 MerR family transcriptional regulator [Actinospica durhamensis]
MGLVSIGEFSRLSRLSPKALRLYDELGLLVPEHVDPATGYRWYADAQLERARLVALLRRIDLPLARIRDVLTLDAASAAERIRGYWAETEAEHATRRELVGHLVARLHGKKPAMYEVAVRDVPARSLLSVVRRVHEDEVIQVSREFFITRMARGGVARVEGVAGAPFTIFHGEVSADSDGPVEFCWPVPDDQAAALAADFPDLALRTEPAHQEVFIAQASPGTWGRASEAELAIQALFAWASENERPTAGGVRSLLIFSPAGERTTPAGEFAVALR